MSENNPNPYGTVTVKVDHSHVELEERAKADKERQLKEEAIKQNAELQAKINAYEAEKAETLAAQELKDEQRANRPRAAGSVPPNTTINGQGRDTRRGFSTYGAMVDSLRVDEQLNSSIAKEQIDTLYAKILSESKESPLNLSGKFNPENKSLASMFNDNCREKWRRSNQNGVEI
jgi:hypothetical protein